MKPNFYVAYDKATTLPVACRSSKDVASALGCTVKTLYAYISDASRPRKYEIHKFCDEQKEAEEALRKEAETT